MRVFTPACWQPATVLSKAAQKGSLTMTSQHANLCSVIYVSIRLVKDMCNPHGVTLLVDNLQSYYIDKNIEIRLVFFLLSRLNQSIKLVVT